MDVQEGNIIIVKFLGGSPNKRKTGKTTTTFWEGDDVPNLMLGASPSTKELRFHRDWNWLMSVVQELQKYTCGTIISESLKHGIAKALCKADKKEVWLACIEFIQWINKVKANNQKQ